MRNSMVSRELRSKIKEFQHHCFHITLFLLTGIKKQWLVDIVSSVVSSITRCHWGLDYLLVRYHYRRN
jgi:hypothetical protein